MSGALRCLAASAMIGLCAPAFSQSETWRYELTPYLWITSMKGDVQSGALPKITTDTSFSDILNVLDFGAMGAFEARKGRWGLLFDAIYMKLSDAATATRTTPGPVGATLTANANLEMKQTVLAAAVAYRAIDGQSPLDVIGGLRYNKIEANAVINASLFAMAGTVAAGANESWVDPYVGARIQHPVSDRWSLIAYGDIGGFGIGSEFTWQAVLGANYDFSRRVTGKVGYRAIYADYDKNGFLYDMTTSGPYLALGIRF